MWQVDAVGFERTGFLTTESAQGTELFGKGPGALALCGQRRAPGWSATEHALSGTVEKVAV